MPVENRRSPRRKPQPASEPRVVELPEMNLVQRITLVMAERMRFAGFTPVHAVAPGYEAPNLIRGAQADHRPNVFTKYKNQKPLFLDALDPAQHDDVTASRWQLFWSAAEQMGGQFHVALPEMVGKRTGTAYAKGKAKAFGVEVHKIWEV